MLETQPDIVPEDDAVPAPQPELEQTPLGWKNPIRAAMAVGGRWGSGLRDVARRCTCGILGHVDENADVEEKKMERDLHGFEKMREGVHATGSYLSLISLCSAHRVVQTISHRLPMRMVKVANLFSPNS